MVQDLKDPNYYAVCRTESGRHYSRREKKREDKLQVGSITSAGSLRASNKTSPVGTSNQNMAFATRAPR